MLLANHSEYCPREFNCSEQPGNVSLSIGRAPSYASLVSSSFSCLGSVLIVLVFLLLPEIRTGAQKLITLLSIADFFTAFGYFIAAVNFLQHYKSLGEGDTGSCNPFGVVCRVQSFITTTSSLCSFLWTMILAVYFHVVIVNKQAEIFGTKMFVLLNIISWGCPLIITIPLMSKEFLGYSPLAAANWCFIQDSQSEPIPKDLLILLVMIAGKFWEILSYIVVTVLYISISVALYRSRRRLGQTRMSQEHVELRLLTIPVAFLLLRLWGTIQFFYFWPQTESSNLPYCIPRSTHRVLLLLGTMQAIGDSGQGWSNAILYIFFSPYIRRLFVCGFFSGCCSKVQEFYLLFNPESQQNQQNRYSRFRDTNGINNAESGEHPPAAEALESSVTYMNRREKAALNRSSRTKTSSADTSYGAVTIRDNGGQTSQSEVMVATHPQEDNVENNEKTELLDTASLTIKR